MGLRVRVVDRDLMKWDEMEFGNPKRRRVTMKNRRERERAMVKRKLIRAVRLRGFRVGWDLGVDLAMAAAGDGDDDDDDDDDDEEEEEGSNDWANPPPRRVLFPTYEDKGMFWDVSFSLYFLFLIPLFFFFFLL